MFGRQAVKEAEQGSIQLQVALEAVDELAVLDDLARAASAERGADELGAEFCGPGASHPGRGDH
jgi:hypothetical protein